MRLLACFAALGVVVALFSALEHDWIHAGFSVTGLAAAIVIGRRMRGAVPEDPTDA